MPSESIAPLCFSSHHVSIVAPLATALPSTAPRGAVRTIRRKATHPTGFPRAHALFAVLLRSTLTQRRWDKHPRPPCSMDAIVGSFPNHWTLSRTAAHRPLKSQLLDARRYRTSDNNSWRGLVSPPSPPAEPRTRLQLMQPTIRPSTLRTKVTFLLVQLRRRCPRQNTAVATGRGVK